MENSPLSELLIDCLLDHQQKGWASSSKVESLKPIYPEKDEAELHDILRRTASEACAYRRELEQKTADELQAIWQPIQRQREEQQQAAAAARLTAERQEMHQRWARKPYWRADEAAALITGNNPEDVSYLQGRPFINLPDSPEAEEAKDLIHRAISQGTLKADRIDPCELIPWLRSLSFPVPASLLALYPQSTPERAPAAPSELPYRTKLIDIMIEAMKEHWTGDYLSRPTKNETVIQWLTERGVTNVVAERIATIIRPDDAPQKAPGKNNG